MAIQPPPTPQSSPSRRASRVRLSTWNMGLAKTHRIATQFVGIQLSGANLLALTVSAASVVAGTVTLVAQKYPNSWPLLISAGVISPLPRPTQCPTRHARRGEGKPQGHAFSCFWPLSRCSHRRELAPSSSKNTAAIRARKEKEFARIPWSFSCSFFADREKGKRIMATPTAITTASTTTVTTYTIEKGLLAVEHLLRTNPKNTRFILGVILEWRGLMKGISLDEGRVVEYLTLDHYAMNEAMLDGSPLYEIRSIDQYHCWKALAKKSQRDRPRSVPLGKRSLFGLASA